MRKLGATSALRAFEPVEFASSSRLTFQRLRRPTALPILSTAGAFSGFLGRLNWLFGNR